MRVRENVFWGEKFVSAHISVMSRFPTQAAKHKLRPRFSRLRDTADMEE
jgi:hypothetical protein